MGEVEIEAFLTHLAVKRKVAASTQNQALSALLCKEVLGRELGWLDKMTQAKCLARLPVVLTVSEVHAGAVGAAGGPSLADGKPAVWDGLTLMECVGLRVKDIDFERLEITVRDGKGAKDRVTLLPGRLVAPL